MTVFLFWFALSVAVGIFAETRGRSSGNWFVLAMLISPVLAFIFCAISKNLKEDTALPSEKTHVHCPKCAEYVLPQASICKHCGTAITPDLQHATRQAEKTNQVEHEKLNSTIVRWCAIVVSILIAWLALR